MNRIYLIRHAKSVGNVKRIYAGDDIPLSDEGISSAKELKTKFSKLQVDRIYVSEYLRTRQTAEIIFENRELIEEPLCNELNFGDFLGHSRDELKMLYPHEYECFKSDPFSVSPPHGETIDELYRRAKKFMAKAFKTGEDVAAVSHHGFICAAICAALGDVGLYFKFEPENLSMTEIRNYDGFITVHSINV